MIVGSVDGIHFSCHDFVADGIQGSFTGPDMGRSPEFARPAARYPMADGGRWDRSESSVATASSTGKFGQRILHQWFTLASEKLGHSPSLSTRLLDGKTFFERVLAPAGKPDDARHLPTPNVDLA